MIVYSLDKILCDAFIVGLFDNFSVELPEKFIPKCIVINREAQIIATEMVSQRNNSKSEIKHIGINFVINVAKKCNLSIDNYGDTEGACECSSMLSQICC